MLKFEKIILSNGLKVIVHNDKTTPVANVNLLYNVGSKDEDPDKTGFAHLFEHLMFGGSKNIPSYDEPLQLVCGENNAFTNTDFTNYYISLPKQNIETAFWLESDRMLELDFSEKSLNIQKSVVCEEFKQRYLNQPYGDVWLHLRPLVYKQHPYQWPTIGKELSHIEKAELFDVKSFFYRHYAPNNAILSVSGDIEMSEVLKLAEKWFLPIEKRTIKDRKLPVEPNQNEKRIFEIKKSLPHNMLYMVFRMKGRNDKSFYTLDLISDILSGGNSSRLHKNLVKNKQVFTEINAYVSGEIECGMFIITGIIEKNTSFDLAETMIWEELNEIKNSKIETKELEKVKTQFESNFYFNEISGLNKAYNLAFYELLGNAADYNNEVTQYQNVKKDDLIKEANCTFNENNLSVLRYYRTK
ncbi:MAG: insulinase family protein [Bacteroidales bacterium]|nr:insulinase family protein [Bacteroidales bacterium]